MATLAVNDISLQVDSVNKSDGFVGVLAASWHWSCQSSDEPGKLLQCLSQWQHYDHSLRC